MSVGPLATSASFSPFIKPSVWIDSYIAPAEDQTAGSTLHLLIVHTTQTGEQSYSLGPVRGRKRNNVRTISSALLGPAKSLHNNSSQLLTDLEESVCNLSFLLPGTGEKVHATFPHSASNQRR